jgi:hypothetical protein
MNNKLKFAAFLVATLLIVACGKEVFLSNNVSNEQSKLVAKHNFTDLTTVNVLQNLQGGSIDDVLENIENALNEAHAYPDQSIGEISVSESVITVPNNCSDEDAATIYQNALSLWSDTYQNFESENPQSILIDLEKQDEIAENGDAIVKISAFVGEAQANEALSPCDNVTFPEANYTFLKSQSNKTTKPYAGGKMTAKLNSKLRNNPCLYFEETQEYTLLSASEKQLLTGKTSLNKADMEYFYCQILTLLQGLDLPAGFQVQSVVVNSDIAIIGNKANGTFFISSIKIGIPKFRTPPCNVVPPPNG